MKKKEFAVGETFQCGLIKLICKTVNSNDITCNDCFFYKEGEHLCNDMAFEICGECNKWDRSDNQNIIFVKVEE